MSKANLKSDYRYCLIVYFADDAERRACAEALENSEYDLFKIGGSLDWNQGESSALDIATTRRVEGAVYCPLTGEYVAVT